MGYRFNFLKPDDPYYANWVNMRRHRLLFWAGVIAWIPIAILNVALVRWLTESDTLSYLGFVPPTLIIYGIRMYSATWPCPRCGNPFYTGTFHSNPAASYCVNCNLPEYAPRDDSTESSNAFTV
jgi:hypothetical protein